MRQKLLVPALIAGAFIIGAWGLSRVVGDGNSSGSTVEVPDQRAAGVPSPQAAVSNTRIAPDFDLKEVMSKANIKLTDYRGKIVLVDFWATWCRPCRMEIPHFVELKKELSPDDFEIIGISVDRQGEAVVKPFVKDWNINYPTVVDTGSVSMAYGGIRSIPTAFLIGREGQILETFVGYRPKEVFVDAINKALVGS